MRRVQNQIIAVETAESGVYGCVSPSVSFCARHGIEGARSAEKAGRFYFKRWKYGAVSYVRTSFKGFLGIGHCGDIGVSKGISQKRIPAAASVPMKRDGGVYVVPVLI